jgi:hypothetical protein
MQYLIALGLLVAAVVAWNYYRNVRPERIKAEATKLRTTAARITGNQLLCLERLASGGPSRPLVQREFEELLRGINQPTLTVTSCLTALIKADCIEYRGRLYYITPFGMKVIAAVAAQSKSKQAVM